MQSIKRPINCYVKWRPLLKYSHFRNLSQTQIISPNFAHGNRLISYNNNNLRSKKKPTTVEDFELLYTLTKEKFLCRYQFKP